MRDYILASEEQITKIIFLLALIKYSVCLEKTLYTKMHENGPVSTTDLKPK
jgi:hypothetical protein